MAGIAKKMAATVAGIMATTVVSLPIAYAADKLDKCYGIAVAGKNDCASANGSHSCQGQSTKDGDPNEWIYVLKGSCEKIVGGTTTPGGNSE